MTKLSHHLPNLRAISSISTNPWSHPPVSEAAPLQPTRTLCPSTIPPFPTAPTTRYPPHLYTTATTGFQLYPSDNHPSTFIQSPPKSTSTTSVYSLAPILTNKSTTTTTKSQPPTTTNSDTTPSNQPQRNNRPPF
jgi:hypothetical protein